MSAVEFRNNGDVQRQVDRAYVKSPVASLCLVCSSVRNRVRVTMSVLIFSWATGTISPFVCAMAAAQDNAGEGGYRI